MSGGDIASIVVGVLTLIGVIITVVAGNNKRDIMTDNKIDNLNTMMNNKMDSLNSSLGNQMTLFNQTVNNKFTMVDDSIKRLEEAQKKYNNLQERTAVLERQVAVMQEHDKDQDRDITDIKSQLTN